MIKGDPRIRVRFASAAPLLLEERRVRSSCGLPGHLRCGINWSPKTHVKCSDCKHVAACLLAVGCGLSQKEVKNLLQLRRKKHFPQTSGIISLSVTHSLCKFQWLSNKWDRPTNFSCSLKRFGTACGLPFECHHTILKVLESVGSIPLRSCTGEGTIVYLILR